MKAEDILGKPLIRLQRAELARLKNRPDGEIDYSDIPPLTDERLAAAFQPNRQLIAVRLDRDVLAWLRSFGPAIRRGLMKSFARQWSKKTLNQGSKHRRSQPERFIFQAEPSNRRQASQRQARHWPDQRCG